MALDWNKYTGRSLPGMGTVGNAVPNNTTFTAPLGNVNPYAQSQPVQSSFLDQAGNVIGAAGRGFGNVATDIVSGAQQYLPEAYNNVTGALGDVGSNLGLDPKEQWGLGLQGAGLAYAALVSDPAMRDYYKKQLGLQREDLRTRQAELGYDPKTGTTDTTRSRASLAKAFG